MNQNEGFIVCEEYTASTPSILAEENKSITFEAVLQEADAPNRNKRIYGKDVLAEALKAPTVQEKIAHKSFYGESGHPLSEDIKRQAYIDQSRISHIVTSYKWEGNILKGIVETAQTAAGYDMRGLIRQGSQVSFSMRALGNVIKEEGSYKRVYGPLMIVAYDWVTIPSHDKAYMTRTISEGYNPTSALNESMITFNMKDLAAYVTHNDKRIKSICESLEFNLASDLSNVDIDRRNQLISIKEGNETLKLFLKNTLLEDMDNYFRMRF